MQTISAYRGYDIAHSGGRYSATDTETGAVLVSRSMKRLTGGIDAIWSSLEAPIKSKGWIDKFVHAAPGVEIRVPIELNVLQRAGAIGLMVMALFGAFSLPSLLDIDRDGKITAVDFHHMINLAVSGSTTVSRTVLMDGRLSKLTVMATNNPAIDYEVASASLEFLSPSAP